MRVFLVVGRTDNSWLANIVNSEGAIIHQYSFGTIEELVSYCASAMYSEASNSKISRYKSQETYHYLETMNNLNSLFSDSVSLGKKKKKIK